MPEGVAAQRLDHSSLLQAPAPVKATQARIDAIVVPSARTAPYLREAAGIASELNCPLLILCSKRARRVEILQDIEDHVIVADVVAVDVPDRVDWLPPFESSAVLSGTAFSGVGDQSLKRNMALLVARMSGWRRLAFLDDDIRIADPADLRRAAAQLDRYDAVGLAIGGCLDNSVVCHAVRDTGRPQGTFVGAGALAVAADRVDGFFPEIYNEDWFFLLNGNDGLRPVARAGQAIQFPYDPYANPDRARRQEFGDVLAEGLFALLGAGGRISDADNRYWTTFLPARRHLIEGLIADAARSALPHRHRIVDSLKAALGRLSIVTPSRCSDFLVAWAKDRDRWAKRLADSGSASSIESALGQLGLAKRITARFNRTGAMPKEPRLRSARRALDAFTSPYA